MNLKKLYKSIIVSPLYGERKWVVLKDIEYTFLTFWKPFTIYIPKWFEFDWASIPRLFHIIGTPMWTDTLPWALFHDYLYRKHLLNREDSVQCFNELMVATNVRFIKRAMFYLWVRIGWWVAWRNNKAKK